MISEIKYPDQDKLKEIVGNNVRKYREEKGITQRELADCLEMKSTQSVSQLERGEFYPSVEKLMKICEYFEITPNDILFNDYVGIDKDKSLYVSAELRNLLREMEIVEAIKVKADLAKEKDDKKAELAELSIIFGAFCNLDNPKDVREIIDYLYEKRLSKLNQYVSNHVYNIEYEKQTSLFQKGKEFIKKKLSF